MRIVEMHWTAASEYQCGGHYICEDLRIVAEVRVGSGIRVAWGEGWSGVRVGVGLVYL